MIGLGISIPKIAINSEGGSLASLVSSLFRNNEPGVWYDPSDMSTMFQDVAGVTPVTAVEQPVGLILDKSQGLVLGPSTTGTGWVTFSFGLFSTSGTGFTAQKTLSGGTDVAYSTNTYNVTLGNFYEITIDVASTNLLDYSVLLSSGSNARSTIPSMSGVGIKKAIIQANVASGAFNLQFRTTRLGDIVVNSISVRELPGNHATQSASASRPILSARYNLLTNTETFSNSTWIKQASNIVPNTIVAPNGTLTADTFRINSGIAVTTPAGVLFTAGSTSYVSQSTITALSAVPYTYSIYVKAANTFTHIQLRVATDQSLVNNGQAANIRLSDGLVVGSTAGTTAVVSNVGDDWWRISFTFTATVAVYFCGLWFWNSSSIASSTGNEGVYIWGAGLRVANEVSGLPVYQRVGNTSTNLADYDTIGFPPYLRFNGSDSWLSTASIDFTSTDKMTVFAGVRKLSDAAIGTVLGLGAANSSGFEVFESDTGAGSGSNNTSFNVYMDNSSFFNGDVAPFSRVAAIEIDRSLPRATETKVRSNGNGKTLFVLGKDATGNFLAYPLYIGRRGGTTLPFNGRIYSLIVRGAQSTAQQIANAEKYVAVKTGFSKPTIIGLPTIGL